MITVSQQDAVALFNALDFPSAAGWDLKRLTKMLNSLADQFDEDSLTSKDPKLVKLFAAILKALGKKEKVEVAAGEEKAPTKEDSKSKKKPSKKDDEDEDEDDEDEDEDEDDEEEDEDEDEEDEDEEDEEDDEEDEDEEEPKSKSKSKKDDEEDEDDEDEDDEDEDDEDEDDEDEDDEDEEDEDEEPKSKSKKKPSTKTKKEPEPVEVDTKAQKSLYKAMSKKEGEGKSHGTLCKEAGLDPEEFDYSGELDDLVKQGKAKLELHGRRRTWIRL